MMYPYYTNIDTVLMIIIIQAVVYLSLTFKDIFKTML